MKKMTKIGKHRDQRKPFYEYWKNKTGVHPAVKEYMTIINDPNGEHFKAAYYSYNKGVEVADRIADEISSKHGVDAKMLRDAHLDEIGAVMLRGTNKYLES